MLTALLLVAAAQAAPAREARLVMGTNAEVWAGGAGVPDAALEAAFAALEAVDRSMSLWKESELTALNRAGHARVSPGLFTTLRYALEVAAASDGAFDPTVEPLVRAAGGLGGRRRRLGPGETKALLARVGFTRVHLDPATREVRLDPGTGLDLGGIAKGYAVDQALQALRDKGATSGFVDLGQSSLGVFGEPLTLDVADPEFPERRAWASFDLRDACVGSSGGSQRGDHIFDPRSGIPARSMLGVTVVARTALEADALSTAVYVLGAERGLELLARRGVAGLVLLRERGRAVLRFTPGFRETYDLQPAPGVRVWQ